VAERVSDDLIVPVDDRLQAQIVPPQIPAPPPGVLFPLACGIGKAVLSAQLPKGPGAGLLVLARQSPGQRPPRIASHLLEAAHRLAQQVVVELPARFEVGAQSPASADETRRGNSTRKLGVFRGFFSSSVVDAGFFSVRLLRLDLNHELNRHNIHGAGVA
jgi:hypothetical protein